MDFEVKKSSKVKKFFLVLFVSLLLTGITIGVLYYTNIISFNNNNNCEINNEKEEEKEDLFKTSKEEIEKIFQKKYSDIYDEIQEGKGFTTSITKEINLDNEIITVYKIDLSKLNNYFTDNCISWLKEKYFYTDDNVNYYNISNQKGYYNLNKSIFSITNQVKRNLKITVYDNDMVVLKADINKCNNELCKNDYGGEYIIFKKVDNIWKIDMFE